MSGPLVSIALPVRNGGEELDAALASLSAQTFPDLEIVVSDNASNDETAATLARWQRMEPRLQVISQALPIPMMANFQAALTATRGHYVMFAAHDDTRALDFIEKLLPPLIEDDSVVLTFGDVLEIGESGEHRPPNRFQTGTLTPARRLRLTARGQCYHFYGLWRGAVLRRIPMADISWWPDLPVMMAAAAVGHFRHVPGVSFTYRFRPRWFFARGRGGGGGWLSIVSLGQLVWQTGRAVARVTGVRLGVIAGVAVSGKIIRQTLVWGARRLRKGRLFA